VTEFDPPETQKYPKKYVKIREYVKKCREKPEERAKYIQFMKDYSLLSSVADVNFMYFSASGSIFGSPNANKGYDILKGFPVGRLIVKGVNQIKDTRLGSFHHTQKIKNLVRESKYPDYPITNENTVFIVGANEEQGDGLVDQPSAHISGHCYVEIDVNKQSDTDTSGKPKYVKMEQLPKLHVVPLELKHFPVKTLWGLGPTLRGSAYMEKGHPVLDYLFSFINRDFDKIDDMEASDKIYMRQFMIEITFSHILDEAETETQLKERRKALFSPGKMLIESFIKDLDVKVIRKPITIDMQGKFFNADNLTYILTGTYKESFLFSLEPEEQTMDLSIRAKGYHPIKLTLPIKAGNIIFVDINLREKE